MNRRMVTLAIILVASLACLAQEQRAPSRAPRLTAADAKYLDGLLKEFLFDPTSAERVVVKMRFVYEWENDNDAFVEGWLLPARGGQPARVYFTDGTSILAPPEKEIRRIDFLDNCTFMYVGRAGE